MHTGRIALIAAAFTGAMLLAAGNALAGTSQSKSAGAPPLSVDPNATALPPSALGEKSRRDPSGTNADTPDLKIPDSIKFGEHTLQFDTDRQSVDSTPRVGLDAVDRHVLPMQKDEDLPPAYFGLKFSTPTR